MNNLFYDNLAKRVNSELQMANSKIDIAVAWFTDYRLFNSICKKLEEGIEVRVIICDDILNFRNDKINFKKIMDLGGELYVSKYPALMHNKFCIIDESLLLNGSYNWTFNASLKNFENVVFSDDIELISQFKDYFKFLCEKVVKVTDWSTIQPSGIIQRKLFENELELIQQDQENFEELNLDHDNIYWEAEKLYRESKLDECIEFVETYLISKATTGSLEYILASAYWRLGKYNEQIKHAKKSLDLIENNIDALNLIGIGYMGQNRFDAAIESFTQCIKENPRELFFINNRAESYRALSEQKKVNTKSRKWEKLFLDDCERILNIISEAGNDNLKYRDWYIKATANAGLNKIKQARNDIKIALKMFRAITDIWQMDKNDYQDMKSLEYSIIKTNRK